MTESLTRAQRSQVGRHAVAGTLTSTQLPDAARHLIPAGFADAHWLVSLLACLPCGVVIADQSGAVRQINPAAVKLLGLCAGDVAERGIDLIVEHLAGLVSAEPEEWSALEHRIRGAQEPWRVMLPRVDAGGRRVSLAGTPLPQRAQALTIDVGSSDAVETSLSREAEQVLAALQVPLADTLDALPSLGVGSGAADEAMRVLTSQAVAQSVSQVQRGVSLLREWIRVRSEEIALTHSPIELGDALMTIIPRWKTLAPLHTFELALPGELPSVMADEGRTHEALMLLLEGAVWLADPGGDTIRVDVRPHGDQVVVSVHGHGPMLRPDQRDALFTATEMPIDGLQAPYAGLGLALARALVAAHGGRVWADSSERTPGTVLYAAWPLVPPGRVIANDAVDELMAVGAPAVAHVRAPHARQVVLLVHADTHVQRYLRANLEAEHFQVAVATTCEEAERQVDLLEPDLLVVDQELAGPGAHPGFVHLRVYAAAPVIVVARRADPLGCAHVLDQGAADYVAMPLSVEELIARARAVLRGKTTAQRSVNQASFATGDLAIDFAQHQVSRGGQPIGLSKTEFKLLRVLAQHAGMVLAHDVLLERVWGPAYSHEVEFLWVYIRRLRRKIEPDPAHPRYIETVPGVGYRLTRVDA